MTRDDEGFTLVELLVSLAILSILIVPMASAVMVSLRTAAVEQRLSDSHNLQISSSYFSTDFASAHSVQPSQRGCAGSEGTLRLSLRIKDPSSAEVDGEPEDGAIDYVLAGNELIRLRCLLNAAPERNVLAREVASVDFGCDAVTPVTPDAPCTAGQRPARLSVTVNGMPPADGGAPAQFRLEGTRRSA